MSLCAQRATSRGAAPASEVIVIYVPRRDLRVRISIGSADLRYAPALTAYGNQAVLLSQRRQEVRVATQAASDRVITGPV